MSLIPAVVIDTSLAVHLEFQFNSWAGPLSYGGSLWCVVTRGSPTYSTAPNRGTHVYKSTDSGSTWTVQDVAGNPGPTTLKSYSYPFALGSTWYFLTVDSSSGHPVFTIYSFDLSGGTWGSSVTTFTDTGVTGANNACLIALRGSPQKFVVVYSDGTHNYAAQYDGSSWGSVQSVSKPSGSNFSMVGVAVDSANTCHVINSTSTDLWYNTFASGAWGGSFTSIDSGFSDNYPLSVIYRPTQDDLLLCYVDSSLSNVEVVKGATITGTPSWSKTAISVPGGHSANPFGCTVAFSPEEQYTNSYLLFVTVDNVTEHGRMYQCTDTGSGFGAASLVWDANVDTIAYPAGWNIVSNRNRLAYAYAVTLNAAQNLLMCLDGAAFNTTGFGNFDFVALYGALDVTPPTTSGARYRAVLI